MRFFRLPVVVLAAFVLSGHGALLAQPPEVSGTLTIDKTVHKVTNVYAFNRRNGLGED